MKRLNLVVQIDPKRWRLLSDRAGPRRSVTEEGLQSGFATSARRVGACSGIWEAGADVILKILNTASGVVDATVQLGGATHTDPKGELTVLTSRSAEGRELI